MALLSIGLAVGWHMREEQLRHEPMITDVTLDTNNRPISIKTYFLQPNGSQIFHGQHFEWDWSPNGSKFHRQIYELGENVEFSSEGVSTTTCTIPIK